MQNQRSAKSDKKYVKGNNSKTVGYNLKQEKRRELAERMKQVDAAAAKPETAAKPKRKSS
jgi:hypothetical protein